MFHEQSMNGHRGEKQALKITYEDNTNRGSNRGVFRGRERGHDKQHFNKATIECLKCHRLRHFHISVRIGKKRFNYAKLDKGEELLLISYEELN